MKIYPEEKCAVNVRGNVYQTKSVCVFPSVTWWESEVVCFKAGVNAREGENEWVFGRVLIMMILMLGSTNQVGWS